MNYTFSLPTFLVVIIIVILFRTLDKRNRSLEKVKRFSDKLKEDISVAIKEKRVEIDEIAVDLDLNLKKSREILKRILAFEEALKAKEGDFKSMKNTVDSYGTTLEELVAMSERVDENLKRIKNESTYIDKVGNQVKDIGLRVGKMEAVLNTSLTRANEKNKLELDKIKKKLLDSHQESISGLEHDLQNVEQNVGNISEYVKKLEDRKGEALKAADKACRELLASLDAEIKKRKQEEIAELSGEMSTILKGAQEEKEQVTQELNSLLAETSDTVQNLDREFTAKIEDFKEQYTQIEKMFHDQLDKAAARGEMFNDQVFAHLKESIDKKAKEQSRQVLAYFNKVNDDLDKKKKEIGELFGVLRADTNVWHAELDKQMKDFERGVNERMVNLENEVSGSMSDYILKTKDTRENVFADMDEFVKTVEKRLAEYEEDVRYKFEKLENCNVDIEALEKSLRTYMESISDKIRQDFGNFTKTLAGERASEKNRASEELQLIKTEIDNIEAEVSSLKTKAYENVSEKLKILEDDFFTDLKERSQAIQQRLDSFQKEITTQIEEISEANETKITNIAKQSFKDKTAELQAFIESKLAETESEIDDHISGTRNEAEQWHEEILKKYRESETDLEQKVTGLIEESTSSIAQIKKDLAVQKADLIENTNKERAQLKDELEKMVSRAALLSQNINEIEKQQKGFVAQTKIFERADSLKLGLESDIGVMKKELAKISAYKKDMDAIAKEFFTTKKLVDDVSVKIRDFVTEKKRINSMETDFKRLIALSQEIDGKVRNITTNYDTVQDLEVKMRSLEDKEKEVDAYFERLEKKKKVLDSTTQGVDKNFQKLTTLEKNISDLNKEMKGIPELIKELTEEVDIITKNKDKADTVVEKMANIDNLILDLDARMDKLSIAREWLARAETRLEKVNNQAQEQLRLLESLIKEEVAQVKKDKGAPSMDKRQTVVKLSHQGWSVQEIARATKLSRGEVELILELIPKK